MRRLIRDSGVEGVAVSDSAYPESECPTIDLEAELPGSFGSMFSYFGNQTAIDDMYPMTVGAYDRFDEIYARYNLTGRWPWEEVLIDRSGYDISRAIPEELTDRRDVVARNVLRDDLIRQGLGSRRKSGLGHVVEQSVDVNRPGMSREMRVLTRRVTRASTNRVFATDAVPSASRCFRVSMGDLKRMVPSGMTAGSNLVFGVREMVSLTTSIGSTIAWNWAAGRVSSRRQAEDAPEVVAFGRALEAINGTIGGGYPVGGFPWAGNTTSGVVETRRMAREGATWHEDAPEFTGVSFDARGLGGQSYEYGPVEWDIRADTMAFKVYEYGRGRLETGEVRTASGFRGSKEEGWWFGNASLSDIRGVDGGYFQKWYMPQERGNMTLDQAKKLVGKTDTEWDYLKFKTVKIYDYGLLNQVMNDHNNEATKYNEKTLELYRALFDFKVRQWKAWGIIETCRSDAGFPWCDTTDETTLASTVFDTHCIGPDRSAMIASCYQDATVRRAIRDYHYSRGFQEYDIELDKTIRENKQYYNSQCHYAHSICFRGHKLAGFSYVASQCSVAPGHPCWPSTPTTRGGVRALRKESVVGGKGLVSPFYGSVHCYLGRGGPECDTTCGDPYDPDHHGMEADFPHKQCGWWDLSTCGEGESPGPGTNCSSHKSCVYVGPHFPTNETRTEGCYRHGECFHPRDPETCQCFGHVSGRHCTQCEDGYWGYVNDPRDLTGDARAKWEEDQIDAFRAHPNGRFGFVPFAEAVRSNGSLVSPTALYGASRAALSTEWIEAVRDTGGDGLPENVTAIFEVPLGGDEGGRRLSSSDDDDGRVTTLPANVTLTARDRSLMRLFNSEETGAILRPPVLDRRGCVGSCWGYRPEDLVGNDATWGDVVETWDAGLSTGRFHLPTACGRDSETGTRPGYPSATETFDEIIARCRLEEAEDADTWLSLARSCPAVPVNVSTLTSSALNATANTTTVVLDDVCNFEETYCVTTTLEAGTRDILGLTPALVFGCPNATSEWDDGYGFRAGRVSFPPTPLEAHDGTMLGCEMLRSGNHSVPLDKDEMMYPGGWLRTPVCGQVSLGCASSASFRDPDRDVELSARRDELVVVNGTCTPCGLVHGSIALSQLGGTSSRTLMLDGIEAWTACPAFCDPESFYEFNGGGWDDRVPTPADRKRTGILPGGWVGCPVDTDNGDVDLVPPRWVADWRQCLPEVFYGDPDGEALEYHLGEAYGRVRVSDPGVIAVRNTSGDGALLGYAWSPSPRLDGIDPSAFNGDWSDAAMSVMVDTGLYINASYHKSLSSSSSSDGTCVYDGDPVKGWQCSYSVRMCFVMGDEGMQCLDVPRPVFQASIGITPQSILGCPASLWAEYVDPYTGEAVRNPLLDTIRASVNASGDVGRRYEGEVVRPHLCSPETFYSLNIGGVTAPPPPLSEGVYYNPNSPWTDTPLSAGTPANTSAFVCSERNSVFRKRQTSRGSGVILGKICGGPRRSKTCSRLSPDCVSTYPQCDEDGGDAFGCLCDNADGCHCREGSGLDARFNCVECLPRHTWVEDGNFDTCVLASECFDATNLECSGHGECFAHATSPVWLGGGNVYGYWTPSHEPPYTSTDGYTNIVSMCVCSPGWSGSQCDMNITDCSVDGALGGASSGLSSVDSFDSGLGNGTAFRGVGCRGASTNTAPSGCSRSALVLPGDPLSHVLPVYELGGLAPGGENFDASQWNEMLHFWLRFPDAGPPSVPIRDTASVCASMGGRVATARDFMSSSDHGRQLYLRYYEYMKGLYEDMTVGTPALSFPPAAGGTVNLVNYKGDRYGVPWDGILRTEETSYASALDYLIDTGVSGPRPPFEFPGPCVVDTCDRIARREHGAFDPLVV